MSAGDDIIEAWFEGLKSAPAPAARPPYVSVRVLWGLYTRLVEGSLVYERWFWGAFLRVRPTGLALAPKPKTTEGADLRPLFEQMQAQHAQIDARFAVLQARVATLSPPTGAGTLPPTSLSVVMRPPMVINDAQNGVAALERYDESDSTGLVDAAVEGVAEGIAETVLGAVFDDD